MNPTCYKYTTEKPCIFLESNALVVQFVCMLELQNFYFEVHEEGISCANKK